MDIFEEANTGVIRALELGEPKVAVEIAREALREASRLGMDDLAEQLHYCIETGHIGKMHNIINAMDTQRRELDVDRINLHFRDVEKVDPSVLSGYNSMN